MLTLIIALLMNLGYVNSADDFYSLPEAEQSNLTEIVIVDVIE